MNKIVKTTDYGTDILIAEDSATQAAQIKYVLESYRYKVMVTQNGLQAIKWLSNHKPSLVISDIIMPEMSGYDLCEKIKTNESTKNIPVILLTSLSNPEEVIEGLSCGADSFISKPYNKEFLISNIEKILAEKPIQESGIDTVGIEINFGGKSRMIRTGPQKVVRLLLNIYQGSIQKNNELLQTRDELRQLNERLEELVKQRTAELIIANKELVLQHAEKERRAAKLIIANKELVFQNEEKEKRASELIIANRELVFQNEEKEKRAAELIIANKELAFQNKEKEKKAAKLIIANKELAFQNEEKEKRASELIIANKELVFQHLEKEKRAAELIIAGKELVFQNEEKEIREAANKELEAFSYSVSHDLRAPLRAINGYARIIHEDYSQILDADGISSLNAILNNSKKMGELIDDLLAFSRLGRNVVPTTEINMTALVKSVREEEMIGNSNEIEFAVQELLPAIGQQVLIKQVWVNLISNAIKYSKYKPKTMIEIGSYIKDNLLVYYVKDNGVGFDMQYYDKLFGVFQRLHSQEEFEGTGIGLAIVQKIIHRHNGTAWAESKLNEGSCFYFSLPNTNS